MTVRRGWCWGGGAGAQHLCEDGEGAAPSSSAPQVDCTLSGLIPPFVRSVEGRQSTTPTIDFLTGTQLLRAFNEAEGAKVTATIINFPSMHERNDREFQRTGSTTYTRAVEEAHTLGSLSNQRALGRPAVLLRADALEITIRGLATWREEVRSIIPIELLPGVLAHISLQDVPRFLRGTLSALNEEPVLASKMA